MAGLSLGIGTWLLLIIVLLLLGISIYLMINLNRERRISRQILREKTQLSAKVEMSNFESFDRDFDKKKELSEKSVKASTLILRFQKLFSTSEMTKIHQALSDILKTDIGALSAQIIINKFSLNPEEPVLENDLKKDFQILWQFGDNNEDYQGISLLPIEDYPIGYVLSRGGQFIAFDIRKNNELAGLVGKGPIPTKMVCALTTVEGEHFGAINISSLDKTRENNYRSEKQVFTLLSKIASQVYQAAFRYQELKAESDSQLQEKKKIRELFGRYISESLLDKFIGDEFSLSLGGEKQKIAILACDIRGFTSISEKRPPYEVVDILNGFFTMASDAISQSDGFLDKFLGDGILVIFGIPMVRGDEVTRAVSVARELVQIGQVYQNDLKRRYGDSIVFRIGIGITYGEAIVGNIGSERRMEYTAIGDTVNTAFRLESKAPGNVILVSEQVVETHSDKKLFRALKPIPLKGKEKPVMVYSVLVQ